MARELIQDKYTILSQTSISTAISATTTSFDIASPHGLPAPPFRAIIEEEVLVVTALSGSTVTVARGVERGIATPHRSGSSFVVPFDSSIGGGDVPIVTPAPFGQVPYSDGAGGLLYSSFHTFSPPFSPAILTGPDLLGIGHASFGDQARINNPSPIPFLSNITFTSIIMLADAVDGQEPLPPTFSAATGIANHIDYNMAVNATYPYYGYDGRLITRANNSFVQGEVRLANLQFINFAVGDFTEAIGLAVEMAQNTNSASSNITELTGISVSLPNIGPGTVGLAYGLHVGVGFVAGATIYAGVAIDTCLGASGSRIRGLTLGDFRPSTTGATDSLAVFSNGGTWDLTPGASAYDAALFHLRRPTTSTVVTTQKMIEMANNLNQVVSGFHYDWSWYPVQRTTAQIINEACCFNSSTSKLVYRDAAGVLHGLYGEVAINDTVVSGLAGCVLFISSTGLLSQETAFRYDDMTNSLGINISTQDPSAQLQVDSTTAGFLPPRLSTTEQNSVASPAAGLQIFNSTTRTPNSYNGFNWIALNGSLFDHFL
jgi:hypothetical protein